MIWKEKEKSELVALPQLVISQIRKGINPRDLTGLSVSVMEYIRTNQLTSQDILLLAGVNIEEAKDIVNTRRKNVNKKGKNGNGVISVRV